jgi:small subunit ribosomal protein S13
MVFIFETEIKNQKSIYFALIQIYGLNKALVNKICKKLGLSKNLKVKDMSIEQNNSLIKLIDNLNIKLNLDLKKYHQEFFTKLINIKSYHGLRKLSRLPVRGQRTHTNAVTCKKTPFSV